MAKTKRNIKISHAMGHTQPRPFGVLDKIGYFLGDTGCNLSFQLVSNYMLLYYTQCVGLRTTTWAWCILIVKCWDAVNDILIGNFVDRIRLSKRSKFKPWILIGGMALVVLTVLVFIPTVKAFPYWGKTVWCLLSFCLWSVAYTMVNVPYGSLHSVITDKDNERVALSTFRAMAMIPVNLLLILLPQLIYTAQTGTGIQTLSARRLFMVSAICAVVSFVAFFAMTNMVEERVVKQEQQVRNNWLVSLKVFFKNRALVGLTLGTIGVVALYNSSLSVNNLVFQFYFGDAKMSSVAMVISYLPLLFFMPFVGIFVKRFGKKKLTVVTSMISFIAGVVAFAIPMHTNRTGMLLYMLALVFLNIGCCVFQIVIWAMVAECVEISCEAADARVEASLYAIYSFFRKLSQGIGSAVVALGLAFVGFQESSPVQTGGTALGIKNFYLLLLTLAVGILCVSMQCMYNLPKNGRQEGDKNA